MERILRKDLNSSPSLTQYLEIRSYIDKKSVKYRILSPNHLKRFTKGVRYMYRVPKQRHGDFSIIKIHFRRLNGYDNLSKTKEKVIPTYQNFFVNTFIIISKNMTRYITYITMNFQNKCCILCNDTTYRRAINGHPCLTSLSL